MNDSNQQPKQETKTFLQQFQETLATVNRHSELLGQTEQAFTLTGATLKQLLEDSMMVQDQLQALYLLSEQGVAISRKSVADKVQELRITGAKNRLEKEEKAGIIKKLDTITNDLSIIVYSDSSQGLVYAYNPVRALGKEIADQLIGKKVGDTVGTVTVIEIYELVENKGTGA